ncbi:hypothetical protein LEN26_018106 [Aphanomyces euteiches]|nr:hypothetical protein LEN26_018106 [Aphanomyces euteiches]KAH9111801.1 hypothetical protein AeMF1_013761 [Aphanomyces euteiches]KAH9188687.1 hypothetical protein AeNC1_009341 [Aphanomyces euteiches]
MGDNIQPPSVTSPSSLDEYRRNSINQSFSSRPDKSSFRRNLPPHPHSLSMGPNAAPYLSNANYSSSSQIPKSSSRRSFGFFGFGDKTSSNSFVGSGPPSNLSMGPDRDTLPTTLATQSSLHSSNSSSFSQATTDGPAGVIINSGYLTKRGHVVTNWKTRFFVLRPGGRLSYYADEGMKKKLGEVHLEKVSPWSGEANGFMFYTTKQIAYYVYASSNSDRKRWLEALSEFYVEPEAVDCEGYLTKRGHLVPSYRLRYFVLSGSTIKYFADETAYRSGASALAEMEVKGGGRWDGESTGLFVKTSTGNTLFLCAENVPELQKWLEAIAKIMGVAERPPPIACAGWLTKQGHKRKSWKKRYFVLRGNTISYFPDFDSSNARMSKPLGEVTVREVSAWDGEANGFMFLTTENVPYYVFADNERDQAKWLSALRKLFESRSSTVEEPEKKCPRCAYVLTGSRFCGACGYNLRGTSNERSRKSQPVVQPPEEEETEETKALDDLDALSEGARTLLLAVMANPSVQIGGDAEGAFASRRSSLSNRNSIEKDIMDALDSDDMDDKDNSNAPPTPPTASPVKQPVIQDSPPKIQQTPSQPPVLPPKPEPRAAPPVVEPPPPPPQPVHKPPTRESTQPDAPIRQSVQSQPRKDFVVPPPSNIESSFSSFGSDAAPPRIPPSVPREPSAAVRTAVKPQHKAIADLLQDSSDEEKEDVSEKATELEEKRSRLYELKGSAKQFDTLPPNDDVHLDSPRVDSPRMSDNDSLVLVGVAGLKEESTPAPPPATARPDPKKDLYMFMEREMQFTPLFVPSADAPVRCRLYASMAYSTSKKILLFLTDSGPLGLWKDAANVPVDVDHPFAMLPYLHRAQQEGFSLFVCNPFSNSAKVFEEGGFERVVPIPQSSTPKEHLLFVWEKYVMPTKADVSIVAFHRGGSLAVTLLQEIESARNKIHRIAFVESKHVVDRDKSTSGVLEFLGRRTIQWESSVDQPVGGQIVDSQERVGCVCLSLGSCVDEPAVLDKAEDAVFAFLTANPSRPGMTAIVKLVRSALRGRRKSNLEVSVAVPRSNSNVFVLGEADAEQTNSDGMTTDESTEPSPEKVDTAAPAPTSQQYYMPKQVASRPKSAPHNQITMKDFELLKVVGQGGFGKVFLAQKVTEPHKGDSYAMKVLKKQHVLSSGLVNTTMAERRILTEISHPFVVKLYYAFQSETKLYLVMDYLSGGSLAMHLRRRRKFPEEWARFYAAEVAAAIAHLHHVNIIYRDAKLENVLMDHEGHVRITDFGLSKQGVSGLQGATTFCGTAAYIAPELLKGQTYGKAADWWSFGILLYEMIGGKPPYYHRNRDIMFQTILKQEWVTFSPEFSDSAVSLIRGLLTRDPMQRLGSGPRGADEVLTHPFFNSIDWADLLAKRIPPPFNPGVGQFDTAYVAQNLHGITTQDRQVSLMYHNEHGPQRHNDFDGFSFVGRSSLNLNAN